MLSQSAFNALLKTLEEPPTTRGLHLRDHRGAQDPETILSRCQRYDFKDTDATADCAPGQQIGGGEGSLRADGLRLWRGMRQVRSDGLSL